MVPSTVSGGGWVRPMVSIATDADGAAHFGQSEVEELGSAAGEHDVAGLEVAVDDSLAMRGVESAGDLDGDAEGFFDGQRSFAEACFEGFSFEMLHDEEVDGVFAADVVEGADVRVIEAGDGSGFALEALGEADAGIF